jgi:hypothetical protein
MLLCYPTVGLAIVAIVLRLPIGGQAPQPTPQLSFRRLSTIHMSYDL